MRYKNITYRIRKDKIKELKDGRTNKSIAEKIGLSESHLCLVLNGSETCPKYLAILLSLIGAHMQVQEYRMQEVVDYFFEKVEK